MDTTSLKKALKDAFDAAYNSASNPDTRDSVLEKLCSDFGDALEAWAKTMKVTVTAPTGQIAVAGSPSAQTNPAPVTISGDPENPAQFGGVS